MAIKERKEREKAEMRKIILEATMELFCEEGYDNVSIRRIAEKIEYSTATIYSYFQDRGDILFELHNIGFNMLYERQLIAQEIEDPRERLSIQGREYIRFAVEFPYYYDTMFIMRTPVEKIQRYENWECGNRAFDILRKNVRECIDAGYFAGQDIDSVAFTLWATAHGFASLYIRQRFSLMQINEQITSNFLESSFRFLRDFIK